MKNFLSRRVRQLRSEMKSNGLKALLITNLVNVRYLSGFTVSSAYLILTSRKSILMSDTRYEEQIQTECPNVEVDIRDARTTLLDSVERVAKMLKLRSLGIESNSITKTTFDAFASKLEAVELIDTKGIVEALRSIKDEFEIDLIRQSIAINQKSFKSIVAQLTEDKTELTIAHDIEHQMRKFGATGTSFDPIVGVGPRAALPHGQPSATRIGEAPFFLIDWGTSYRGYASDLTRIVVTGKITGRFEKIYQTVLRAQKAAIRKIRPGATLKSVDNAARSVIEKAGFGKLFGHGLGHSFGLEIHEQPYMSPVSQGRLRPGMVVTVEPGVYVPGFAGVRIEDDVLVTSEGHEVLSNLPKQLGECTVDL